MAYPCSEQWLTTSAMASRLGIHPKTLLRLRSSCFSPFQEGLHYRRGGLTTRAPFQWHGDRCEEAFTQFGRVDPDREGDLPQAGWSVGAGRAGTDYRSLISVLNLPKRPGHHGSLSGIHQPDERPHSETVHWLSWDPASTGEEGPRGYRVKILYQKASRSSRSPRPQPGRKGRRLFGRCARPACSRFGSARMA